MPKVKTLADLGRLVAACHGWPAAKAFKAYDMTDADRSANGTAALDLLKVFPAAPHASAALSAALAVKLERDISAPVQVVAGTLRVEGDPIWEDQREGKPTFLRTDGATWTGHVWLMLGAYVVDIAIFREAYSATGPSALSRHVDLVFGPGKALYVDRWNSTQKAGLSYEPHHVLSEGDVTALMAEAYRLIEDSRAAPR